MTTAFFELRQATRSILRSRGFLSFAVGLLAVGIGAAASLFALADHLAFRPLPYPGASRLVAVWRTIEGEFLEGQFLGPDFEEVEGASRSFESLGMACPSSPVLDGSEGTVTITAARVTPRFFEVLKVVPLLGRASFTAEEDGFGGPAAVLLTHESWRRRFSGDPSIVGKTIALDGRSTVVVGVLPSGFRAPTPRLRGTELFVPLALTPEEREARGANFEVVGRLREGATRERAGLELRALAGTLGWGPVGLRVTSLAEGLARPYRSTMALLAAAVALLVLIACGNVSSLMLARGSARTTELALRAALGAEPRVLARQVLAESLLLGLGGLLAGLGLSLVLTRLLAAWLGLPATPPLNGLVLALSAATAVLVALLSGLVPALQVSRTDPATVLREAPARPSRSAFRSALVVSEVALATSLLVGAGLLVRSLEAQLEADPGFDTRGTLVGSIPLPATLFPSAGSRLAFARDLEERLRALPGTEAAGLALPVPLVDPGGWGVVEEPETGRSVKAFRHWVSPGAPAAMGLRLLAGRALRDGDRDACLVSRPLADALWPGEEPLGRRLSGEWTVVGLVAGTREQSLQEPLRAQLFIPLDGEVPFLDVLLRARGNPGAHAAAVHRVVRELSPRLPVTGLEPLDAAVRRNADHAGRSAGLLATFAGAALLLSSGGTYSVLRFLTLRRTREIGLRMALGAEAWQVALLVLGQGLRLAALGAALGLLGATGLAALLRSQIHGISRLDPGSFLGAAALSLAAAALASLLPALRAARVDPSVALRAE